MFTKKNSLKNRAGFLLTLLLTLSAAQSLSAKEYQVTGPVLEVTDSQIVVDKKGEKFEISRGANTKIKTEPGNELKVGSKVTVYYTMAAQEIEIKAEKKAGAKKKK